MSLAPDTDPRLSSFFVKDAQKAQVHLWGYPDDEGIRLNGGRPGAAQGPDSIRQVFAKMTPPLLGSRKPLHIWDGGNLDLKVPLENRHETALSQVKKSYKSKAFVISLGGGHDYGFPDASAFVQSFSKGSKKPVVINFDAHLDVRPIDRGLTSGTPFFRLLEKHSEEVHFLEVGIQNHCNSKSHFQWCLDHSARILTLDTLTKKGLVPSLQKELKKWKHHPLFLSVDIDVFSSAIAPGASQSWPTGLLPEPFLEAWEFLFEHLDVKGLGIYEVSPPLDHPPLTSRWAALIVYRSLQLKGLL